MKKEELLKIFYKYGFHSLRKEPFLYEGNQGLGISFTFKDAFYGSLTRLFIPKTIEEAEDFLGKYYWYKKNGSKYKTSLVLSDYQIENPEIKFMILNEELSLAKMLTMKEPINNTKDIIKETSYLKKITRTALLMVNIIEEKVKLQNTTYLNLVSLNKNYRTLKRKLFDLEQTYAHTKEIYPEEPSFSEDLKDYTNDLLEMKTYIEKASKEELESYIKVLISFLQNLEISESFIQNKYELIKRPLEIEDLQKQITIMEELITKKKGMFSKKESIEDALTKVNSNSALKNIVTFAQYQKNECQRVQEKYTMIADVDIRTIGDFFIEFDNLTLQEPIVELPKEEHLKVKTYEEIMEQLETDFKRRSKEEQQILTLYHSILKNIRLLLEFNQKELLSNYVQEFIDLIEQTNNIMFKIKYFKHIDTSSVATCLETIQTELAKINSIEPDTLEGSLNVFFKDSKVISPGKYLESTNKRNLAPSERLRDNDVFFIATLKAKTKVYFIPTEITYDYANEDTLIQKNNQPFFLIDMEKNKIISENSAIIKVINYVETKKRTDLGMIVTELKNNKTDQYQKITIGAQDE